MATGPCICPNGRQGCCPAKALMVLPYARVRNAPFIGLGIALLLTGPAMFSGELVGSPMAETYGHAWVRWWTAMEWPAWSQGTTLVAGASSWPVIDPLPTWFFGGVARLVGDTWAWNLSAAAGIVVTALGGAALARSFGGSPIFGAAISPLMPIYVGSIHSGLTEDYFLGFVGLALAAGVEKRWIAAGFLAGLSAWCGLYLGWFAGIGLAVLATFRAARWLWLGRREKQKLTARDVGLAAGRAATLPLLGLAVAAAISLGAAWPFLSQLEGGEPTRPPAAFEPLYALNPWRAADAASFLTPGGPTTDGPATDDLVMRQHPTYLGGITLLLAGLGGGHPAAGAVVVFAAASLGDTISVAGNPTGIGNPVAALLHRVPMGNKFRNHARLMLLGQLLLVAVASRGARKLAFRVGKDPIRNLQAGTGLAVLAVLGETVLLSPARLPLSTTPTTAPAIYAHLPTGPEPVWVFGERNPQKPLYDQRFHGHPLQNSPNRPASAKVQPQTGVVVVFDGSNPGPGAPPPPDWIETLGPPDASAAGAKAWWPKH